MHCPCWCCLILLLVGVLVMEILPSSKILELGDLCIGEASYAMDGRLSEDFVFWTRVLEMGYLEDYLNLSLMSVSSVGGDHLTFYLALLEQNSLFHYGHDGQYVHHLLYYFVDQATVDYPK